MKQVQLRGDLPKDLGLHDQTFSEFMYWLYCPVKVPGMSIVKLPDNLQQYADLIVSSMLDALDLRGPDEIAASYFYVTAKRIWVEPGAPGNRPGWHADGFLSEDLNYVWADMNPTIFWDGFPFSVVAEHNSSLHQMRSICDNDARRWRTYPDKHLLRMDQHVLHKVKDVGVKAGFRTFFKLSISRNVYNLEGNSINHLLLTEFPYETVAGRKDERNDPALGANE